MRQIELLRFALDVLDRLQIDYAIVGSYASSIWGEPRMTLDIDMAILLNAQQVEPLLDAFPSNEFYLSRVAMEQAIADCGQFNVIHPSSGNKIDFMVLESTVPTQPTIARRRKVRITPDCEAHVAAPEDVIVSKLRYYQEGGSDKHLRDIAGILKRTSELVDRQYVAQWAKTHNASDIWNDLLTRERGS